MIFQKARLLLDFLSPRVSELSATAVCFPVETDLPLSRLISLAQESQIYQPLPCAFLWKPTRLSCHLPAVASTAALLLLTFFLAAPPRSPGAFFAQR